MVLSCNPLNDKIMPSYIDVCIYVSRVFSDEATSKQNIHNNANHTIQIRDWSIFKAYLNTGLHGQNHAFQYSNIYIQDPI